MKKYKCMFPNCEYETNESFEIHKHHIHPKELGGKNKNNLIYFCPTHHNLIFISNSKSGIHSIYSENKIEILNILDSTFGKILYYKQNNQEYYYSYYYHKCLIFS